jgi:hypothetical protein
VTAWGEAGKAPRALDEAGPRITFVVACLALIGELGPKGPLSAEAVVDVLRGRRVCGRPQF